MCSTREVLEKDRKQWKYRHVVVHSVESFTLLGIVSNLGFLAAAEQIICSNTFVGYLCFKHFNSIERSNVIKYFHAI